MSNWIYFKIVVKENKGQLLGNILDEEIGEYLTELAARYNYYSLQKILSKKLDKTIHKECALTDDLVFELTGLYFKKYFRT